MSDFALVHRLLACPTVTADGAALKEVACLLLVLNDAPEYARNCVEGYLKSRYRQPVYIMTQRDIEPAEAVNES